MLTYWVLGEAQVIVERQYVNHSAIGIRLVRPQTEVAAQVFHTVALMTQRPAHASCDLVPEINKLIPRFDGQPQRQIVRHHAKDTLPLLPDAGGNGHAEG